MTPADPFERAVTDIGAGRPVIVVNGLLGVCAVGLSTAHVTEDVVNFFVTQCRGMIYVALREPRLFALGIPRQRSSGLNASNLFVAVDLADDTTTGISVRDRTKTIAALGDPRTRPDAFTMPGHVVPLALDPSGVLGRWGTGEAFSEVAQAAGLLPSVTFTTLLNARGEIGGQADWEEVAARHSMTICSIADVIRARRRRGERRDVRSASLNMERYELPYTGSSVVCLVKVGTGLCSEIPLAIHDFCMSAYLDASQCNCRERIVADRRALDDLDGGAIGVLQSSRLGPLGCSQTNQGSAAFRREALADLVAAHLCGGFATSFPTQS